ncbi:hypothetical protein E4U43_000455 [Claviceps pusilla]|uniref:Transcription factor domain-containing protein n=1 Tax=Claviceps pusilla TaxID=123648 RepID=A0A9P7T051_9HYPO|nr:hypothetical protein E4U43_000455 [Claviceps pusilla]
MAFCKDRYASIGTGWPMTIDERDIMTKMPSSDKAYDMSRPEQTQTLAESTAPSGVAKLSSFGGVVLMACLLGRNLVHLHRPDDDDLDHDLSGPFWKRHRQMDSILLNTSLGLPAHLKLPSGLSSPNVIFTNMSIHTSTICLHQAAIFKADKNKLGASVSSESKVRCITAANEIASIMRSISHMDLSAMNPFISFCLYVAARVFVQYLKSRPDDAHVADSLRFLLSAMEALKRRNPLTESFLVQLDVDLEALATRVPKLRSTFLRQSAFGSQVERAGPLCSDREGMQGILTYRDCDYMKATDEDANPCNGPDVVNGSAPASTSTSTSTSAPVSVSASAPSSAAAPAPAPAPAPGAGGYGGQSWLAADRASSVTGLTSTRGTMFEGNGSTAARASRFGDVVNGAGLDKQTTPEAGHSNGRTPNSASAAAGGSDAKPRLPSGDSAFHPSPISPHHDLLNPGPPLDVGGHQGFYAGTTAGFAMGHGHAMPTAQQPHPSYPLSTTGWPDMIGGQAQPQVQAHAHAHGVHAPGPVPAPNMPPVGEGVLRALMNMGPMDAMDLSSWDTGHDSAMRG